MTIRQLVSCMLLSGSAVTAMAQYYGSTVFVEGFDGETFPASWTQENTGADNTAQWTLGSEDNPRFSTIEPASTRSARIAVESRDTRLTLTSPVIDAVGKSGLQVGFYGNELNYAFRGGIDFRFRASHDGGATWTDLFSSTQGSSYTGVPVQNWNLYKYQLPSEFDGCRILLQFYIDASGAFSPQGLPGYIDGVFMSLVPEVDPEITGINYSTDDRRPSEGVYTASEPLRLIMRNSGTRDLAGAEFYYSINGGAEHSESCTFATPVAPGDSYTFSFSEGIDLSATGHRQTITAGVRAEGDPIESNNEITAYAENLVVSVPYIPFFHNEDGVESTSDDSWKTFENNYEYGWSYMDWNDFFWYVEPEYNDDPNDAYLVSRPVAMEGGNAYRIEFSAYTEDEGTGVNIMKVYVSTDADMESDLHEIWSNDNITEDNALKQSAVFTAPESGIYYVGFHSLSEAGAGVMYLRDIAFYHNVDKDAAVLSVESPAPAAYRYGDAETVKATIANYGTDAIAAGTAKMHLDIDGTEALVEAVAEALAPNSSKEFTFTKTVDLSDLGTAHMMRVWIELSGDEDPGNDAVEYMLESDLTLVPYIPDMGTSANKGTDVARWNSADHNGDGYTFTARSDADLDTYVFSYGGGMYGFTTVTLPSSDESLSSRHIQLEGGKTYKLSYVSRIGMEGGSLPLAIRLVNTADGTTADVSSVNVTSPVYTENTVAFTPASDGIYQLRFDVADNKAIDYRIYLGKFRLTERFARDLSAEKIIVPSRYVSEINNYPVGLVVRNNGTEAVTSFTLKATSESTGTHTMNFDKVLLEPDAQYTVYFNDDFAFTGSGEEKLEISVSTEGDGFAGNDTASETLTYIEPYELPYSLLPGEALEHMAAFNLNRDAFAFTPDRSMSLGYTYLSDGSVEANDYLATPAVKLGAGKAMRVSFSYYVLEGDTTDVDVFAYDAATDTRVPVITLKEVSQNTMSRYIGFFSVPADGAYSICLQPQGNTRSLFVNASVTVEEADVMPDLAITRLLTHSKAAVLGDNERVEVEFTGNSQQGVECVPFELEVGGRIYHSQFTRYTSLCSEGESYRIAFEGVDLSTPGTYTAVCRAIVPLDSKPEDNEKTFEITSLPIVDAAVTSLDSPVSGKLSHEESVTVSIANNGKGELRGVKLTCVVSGPADSHATLEGTLEDAIADGAKVAYTFAKTVDLDAEGIYTFTITAQAEGDVNADNNTLTVQINSTQKDFDAGVSALVSPSDAALGKAESITIAVSNYGEADLFDVPVKAGVSFAGDEDTQMLEGIVPSVPLGETVEYTFTGTVDMKRCGVYTVVAATALNRDVNSSNDALTATVRCLTQDVGVSAILSPVTGENLGVCDVTVTVTNYGEAAVSSIPMKYQIGTMPQLAVMEETIEPGESKDFTFPVPYEFTSYRKATVKASTMLENDANPDNDAMEAEVENLQSGIDAVTVTSSVWPNPTYGTVNISAPKAILLVEAYDMGGRLLAGFDGGKTQQLQINLSVPAGRYILRIVFTDGTTAVSHLIVM